MRARKNRNLLAVSLSNFEVNKHLFRPFDTATDDQLALKPSRKVSKRKRRLAAAECQEDPVRIAYYVLDPKAGLNFLDAIPQSRENCRG
jgi:hypothetical protein